MAIEGPLKELGIHDVFQLLDLSRKTGKLTVTSKLRHNAGVVYFENGAVVFAEIESNPHLLGSLLVKSGKITDADLQRAREMQQQGDERRLGEILVEIGAITKRELERQVRFQVEEVVFELVGWREGYFSFVEGSSDDLPLDARVRIPTESLLMEGARRIDEWSQIERKIPHLGVVPDFAPLNEQTEDGHLELLPAEWEVLAVIDGERDVREVAGALGRSEFDVAKAIFGMESAGVLRVREPILDLEGEESVLEDAEEALDGGDLDRARRLLEKECQARPHEAAAHLLVGRLALMEKRASDAEESLRRTLRIDPMLVDGHRLLGNALAMQGRYAEAVQWWQRWLSFAEQVHLDEADLVQVREALSAVEKLDTLLSRTHG